MHLNNSTKQGIPSGTVEMFGAKMIQRMHVLKIIESVYLQYGFDPLATPVLEYAQVFHGHHGEGEKLLFQLQDREANKLVLRYDLTVPMARYVADHPESPIPFKRYQIATVFRDDEVDKGHFREFTQCDGDVIGISDRSADAEVINIAFTGLSRLGFSDFIINVNHRSIINAVAEKCGLSGRDGRLLIQRALDEVSKFSEKWVYRDDPFYIDSFKLKIQQILEKRGLTAEAIQTIVFLCTLTGDIEQKLLKIEHFLSNYSEGVYGINELREIFSYLDSDVKKSIKLDLSLARGADYYTGFILEGSIPNIPVGAVLGGGRFDNLVSALGGPNLPAVGMAFGLERILTALLELNLSTSSSVVMRIMVVPTSDEQKLSLLDFTKNLRKNGLDVDFIPMISRHEDEIIEYARKRGFSAIAKYSDDGVLLQLIENGKVVTTDITSLLAKS